MTYPEPLCVEVWHNKTRKLPDVKFFWKYSTNYQNRRNGSKDNATVVAGKTPIPKRKGYISFQGYFNLG
jgi:hypothetical protein